MAKQEHRTARKDYPESGIKKGDKYWFAQIKTGPRSSKTIRSLDRIPESQMTSSPFKSGWFSMMEAWAASSKDGDAMREAAEAIRELGDEAQNAYDNMPDGLKMGDTGQMLETRATECASKADELDDYASTYDAADEYEEPEWPEDPDDEEAMAEYERSQEEYEDAQREADHAVSAADEVIDDMPE